MSTFYQVLILNLKVTKNEFDILSFIIYTSNQNNLILKFNIISNLYFCGKKKISELVSILLSKV